MPADRREYLRIYFRDYNSRPARAAYLRTYQRERRGTEPKADATVQRVHSPDGGVIRRMSSWLCERGGSGAGEERA